MGNSLGSPNDFSRSRTVLGSPPRKRPGAERLNKRVCCSLVEAARPKLCFLGAPRSREGSLPVYNRVRLSGRSRLDSGAAGSRASPLYARVGSAGRVGARKGEINAPARSSEPVGAELGRSSADFFLFYSLSISGGCGARRTDSASNHRAGQRRFGTPSSETGGCWIKTRTLTAM